MTRSISDAWFFRVKAATRDLIARCGGVVRSGEIANVSKTEISRWQGVGDEGIISIPAVLALEADCGMPLVTSVMADLQGRRLSDGDAEGAAASCLYKDHADVMRRSAEVTATLAEGLADGTLTAAEIERVDSAARDLDTSLDQLRGNLARARVVSIGVRGGR